MKLRTAATAFVITTGVVGLLRQRHETALVQRGELAPLGARTRTVAPREGPAARAVASWVPGRPRTRLGRIAATAWAAPLTLVGAAVGYASAARPQWDEALGCWVFVSARGGASRVFALTSASANAVGQVVLTRRDQPSPGLLAHEAVHVRQAERLGPLLIPLYTWWWARHGYRAHPLERAARLGAQRWADENAPAAAGA